MWFLSSSHKEFICHVHNYAFQVSFSVWVPVNIVICESMNPSYSLQSNRLIKLSDNGRFLSLRSHFLYPLASYIDTYIIKSKYD